MAHIRRCGGLIYMIEVHDNLRLHDGFNHQGVLITKNIMANLAASILSPYSLHSTSSKVRTQEWGQLLWVFAGPRPTLTSIMVEIIMVRCS